MNSTANYANTFIQKIDARKYEKKLENLNQVFTNIKIFNNARKINMTRIIICAIIAGIMGAILAVIEQQAGLDLGNAPYFGIGVVCGLLGIITDKDD